MGARASKFKVGDIVPFPGWEYWLKTGSRLIEVFKIDHVEPLTIILRSGEVHITPEAGYYRCRQWSVQEKKWVNNLSCMSDRDGRAMFEWDSQFERQLEVIEPLSLLVKWGIG